MSMLLKDGPICIALIQQKDKTKYQSAFYDQSIHICIASSATLKKMYLKDDLQIKNCLKAAFLNAGLPPRTVIPGFTRLPPGFIQLPIFCQLLFQLLGGKFGSGTLYFSRKY